MSERSVREKLEQPIVSSKYQYAMDTVTNRLKLIGADLTEQYRRPIIQNISGRIKSAESICKKLEKKKLEVSFNIAAEKLNDIAGVRAVCFFCDDIYCVAEALRKQPDIRVIKEKDYVKRPKKSGYQSLHLIVEVDLSYNSYNNGTEKIRVEIQLRSFAMDYWAQLDNQMCYKKSAGEIEAIEREIRNYSAVMAEMDNRMLELRKRIEAAYV